ncbi:MAG: DUF3040 domain-containing protein [Nocardioidaceae bacterium]
MPLSEEEQRLLEQMEEALAAEDPKFVSALRGTHTRARHRQLAFLGVAGFLIGTAALMAGAVLMLTAVAVAGFVVMLGSAYLAITNFRRLRDPDLPDNVHPIGNAKGKTKSSSVKQGKFMNRMEDRWRRRRDEY